MVSQRMTYWCIYHLKREGTSILRAPPIRNNRQFIDNSRRLVLPTAFFQHFQKRNERARLAPFTGYGDDKTAETHSRALEKAREVFKQGKAGSPDHYTFEEEKIHTGAGAERQPLAAQALLVYGLQMHPQFKKLGGPYIAEHHEKDYGRKGSC